MGALLRLVITAIAIAVAAYLLPARYLAVEDAGSVLLFALVLGVLNALVRPILLFFTLPLNLLTLGLFTFVVNAFVFWLATRLPLGVSVGGAAGGLEGAFFAALVVSVVSFVLSRLVP